jgi:hypothetical protein
MKLKNAKNVLKGGLFAFLLSVVALVASADPAVVVSKQENVPINGNMQTKIFLDTTPSDGNNRAVAFIESYGTSLITSIQEFSDLIQVGDVIDYNPPSNPPREGRYTVISLGRIISLNGRNIYEIFVNEIGDKVEARMYSDARRAYEAQQSGGR